MTEIVKIEPAFIEVMNSYLRHNSIIAVSQELNLEMDYVSQVLSRPECKRYIDNVYLEQGYRNRSKLGELLDQIIDKKIEELDDLDMGYSNKDILDIISLAHKMRMDEAKLSLEREKETIKNQTNIQINDNAGSNYQTLLEKLLTSEVKNEDK